MLLYRVNGPFTSGHPCHQLAVAGLSQNFWLLSITEENKEFTKLTEFGYAPTTFFILRRRSIVWVNTSSEKRINIEKLRIEMNNNNLKIRMSKFQTLLNGLIFK